MLFRQLVLLVSMIGVVVSTIGMLVSTIGVASGFHGRGLSMFAAIASASTSPREARPVVSLELVR